LKLVEALNHREASEAARMSKLPAASITYPVFLMTLLIDWVSSLRSRFNPGADWLMVRDWSSSSTLRHPDSLCGKLACTGGATFILKPLDGLAGSTLG
jgi:hypothetical protein